MGEARAVPVASASSYPGASDADADADDDARTRTREVPPLAILACAVVAVSSAAVAFRALPDVPPLLLASWRLQATSIVLFPGFVRDAKRAAADDIERFRASAPELVASGACLGAHFGLWVWGLQTTSVPHSLLFVCSTPVLMSSCAALLGFPVRARDAIAAGVAAVGVILIAADANRRGDDSHASSSASPIRATWYGDVLSVGAAFAMAGHVLVGRKLRPRMPLFAYAFPATLVAAACLAIASAVGGESSSDGGGGGGAGWVRSPRAALVVCYLALGPGLVGHGGVNASLKHFDAMTIAFALTLEPAIGSAIAYACGYAVRRNGRRPARRSAILGSARLGSTRLGSARLARRRRRRRRRLPSARSSFPTPRSFLFLFARRASLSTNARPARRSTDD